MTDAALQQKRLIAAVIDIVIALGAIIALTLAGWVLTAALGWASGSSSVASYLSRIFNFLGALVGLAYILGRDVLLDGRSPGKKSQDLKVLGAGGGPLRLEESVRRNAIFAVGSALGVLSTGLQLFPCVGDVVACLLTPLLLLGGVAAFAAAIVEIVMIIQDPAGIRLGDKFARTKVVRG